MEILLAFLGSAGVFSLLQFLISRHDKKREMKDGVGKQLAIINERLKKSEVSDVQTHLLILINHFPTDHKAILAEAEKYFLDLKEDSWMMWIVSDWAKKEGVNINYLTEAHERNKRTDGR